ncbi:MAG: septum formation initiator family protein [Clostridia bacterium]|nr:septum formation initiator family protein [Clostridia bacterium]
MRQPISAETRPARKRSIILRFGIFVFAVFMVISMGRLQVELVQKKDRLSAAKKQLEATELKIEELQNLLENGEESDFIERVARERLGYVYSDEEVYTDISGK